MEQQISEYDKAFRVLNNIAWVLDLFKKDSMFRFYEDSELFIKHPELKTIIKTPNGDHLYIIEIMLGCLYTYGLVKIHTVFDELSKLFVTYYFIPSDMRCYDVSKRLEYYNSYL